MNRHFRAFIFWLFLFCYIPKMVYAIDELAPKITTVKQGQIVPFDGVLLNAASAAKVFVQKDHSEEECKLTVDFEVEKEHLRAQKEIDRLESSITFSTERYESIISNREIQIRDLQKLASELEEPPDYTLWWFSGGVALGMAVTIGISFAIAELE